MCEIVQFLMPHPMYAFPIMSTQCTENKQVLLKYPKQSLSQKHILLFLQILFFFCVSVFSACALVVNKMQPYKIPCYHTHTMTHHSPIAIWFIATFFHFSFYMENATHKKNLQVLYSNNNFSCWKTIELKQIYLQMILGI